MKAPRDSSREDRLQLHREKMRNKRARNLRFGERNSVNGWLSTARHNGRIWPNGRVAKPGRMS